MSNITTENRPFFVRQKNIQTSMRIVTLTTERAGLKMNAMVDIPNLIVIKDMRTTAGNIITF